MRPPRLEPRQGAHQQKAEYPGCLDVHADVVGIELSVLRCPPREGIPKEGRQKRSQFLHAGLEVVDHHHRLARVRPDFLSDSLEPRCAGLQVRDADDVLVAHPQRHLARDLRGKPRVCVEERFHPFAEQGHIRGTLVVLKARYGEVHDVLQLRRALQRHRLLRRGARSRGDLAAGGEAAQARLGAAPAAADRLLAGLAGQGKRAAARHGAEQDGVDHGAAVLRELAHVEQHCPFRQLPAGCDDARAVEAAVGHLHFFHGGVDAVRGGDQRGALRADVAVLHRAPRLDQLGGDHDVHVAGAWRQREHGTSSGQLLLGRGEDLQVVRGRPGTLRDAGDRGALRRVAALRGSICQPVGHDAAAFAAERGDQDRNRPVWKIHEKIF